MSRVGHPRRGSRMRPHRVAMVVHSGYPWDERVKREAVALVDGGFDVDVVCLRQHRHEQPESVVDGVRVFRVAMQRRRGRARLGYIAEYLSFLAAATWRLARLHIKRRYELVQVHTLPDILVLAALPCKLTGARTILDMHDLTPELYLSKYGLSLGGLTMRLLRGAERMATAMVDHVVTSSEAFKRRLIERGVPEAKITVVINSADPRIFGWRGPRRHPRSGDDFVLVWHGSVVERYGLDLAVAAIGLLRRRMPQVRLRIYGEGEFLPRVEEMVRGLGLQDHVTLGGHVAHEEIPALCDDADLGIVPNRPDAHIDLAFPTKLFEFVTIGIPVVATRTPILESLFDDDAILFCQATATGIAERLMWAYEHPTEIGAAAVRAREAYGQVEWSHMRRTYLQLVSELLSADSVEAKEETTRYSDKGSAESA